MKKVIEIFINVILWCVGIVIILYYVKNIGYIKNSYANFIPSVIIGTLFNVVLFYTTCFYVVLKFFKKGSFYKLIIYILLMIIVLGLVETIIDFFLFRPYYSSVQESFTSQFIVTIVLNLIFVLVALTYGIIRVWIKSEQQRHIAKQEKTLAELEMLKSQINPHVFFNMLNMAFSSAINYGDQKTADIISKIANHMRYVIYESNVSTINISKEVNQIKEYVELERMRISNDLNIEISENYIIQEDVMIAPLLLQPFIENAFKHSKSYNAVNFIDIHIVASIEEIVFKCKNSCVEKKNSTSKGIGIQNVMRRLDIIYKQRYLIDIDEKNGVFSVDLRIKL